MAWGAQNAGTSARGAQGPLNGTQRFIVRAPATHGARGSVHCTALHNSAIEGHDACPSPRRTLTAVAGTWQRPPTHKHILCPGQGIW